MIKVQIGNDERDLRDVVVGWLRSSLEELRRSGAAACVRVRIDEGNVDMSLATMDCPGGEGGRPFRGEEKKIFEEWRRHRLDTAHFTPRDLEEFLAALKKH